MIPDGYPIKTVLYCDSHGDVEAARKWAKDKGLTSDDVSIRTGKWAHDRPEYVKIVTKRVLRLK